LPWQTPQKIRRAIVPNQYAPKHFLRQAQTALLQQYFSSQGLLSDIKWADTPAPDDETIFSAWHSLPEETKSKIERDFRDIYDLASAEGVRTVVEEGQYHKTNLTTELETCDGFLNKILHVFIKHPRIFEIACRFDHADSLNGRCWNKRKDMPKKKPEVSKEALGKFAAAISEYLQKTQGRGEKCLVDTYYRNRRRNYFFAYPKDYTDTYIDYDSEGKIERRPYTPAFEIVFVYDSIDGTLDLFAQGDKDVKQELQRLFTLHILNEKLGEEKLDSAPYKLEALKHRGFAFPVDAADGINNVRIREMSLSVIGRPRQRIIFDAGPIGKTTAKDDIYDTMQTALHESRLPLSMLKVNSVVIQMQFLNTTGRGRAYKTLTFRVSCPDGCNLKDKDEHIKAKKYLREWKIESV